MKTIAGILVLVMLVTLVAVSGSRAQPLPGSSVAFQQCLGQAALSDGRCTSAVRLVAGADEFGGDRAMDQAGHGDLGHTGYSDFGHTQGEALSSPDFWARVLQEVAKVFFQEVVRWALDRYFGGTAFATDSAHTSSVIFDPIK